MLGLASLALLAFILVIAGATYCWTFTPMGRLDYKAALISRLASWRKRPMRMTPEARRKANAFMARAVAKASLTATVRTENRTIVGPGGQKVPIRLFWPDVPGPLPLYLDIHGGGWWMGDGHPFSAVTGSFAEKAGVIVVSVDYRLAPEHPYPAALQDCFTALVWISQNAGTIGGDPARIAIGGASAGGNLAAALALRTRDLGGPKVSFQYLLVPATDLSGIHDWPSYQEADDRYMLKVSELQQMIAAYVPDPALRSNPYVSPLLARDLGGLPPALIVTAQFDPLRDEGEAYARRLQDAGVPVKLHRENGAIHGLIGSPDRFREIMRMSAKALREAMKQQAS